MEVTESGVIQYFCLNIIYIIYIVATDNNCLRFYCTVAVEGGVDMFLEIGRCTFRLTLNASKKLCDMEVWILFQQHR